MEGEIAKAEIDEDPLIIEEANRKFDEFMNDYTFFFSKGGMTKTFKQKELKVVKDKIAINIKRALERIKKSSSTIWQHFNSSMAPLPSMPV